MLRVGILGCGRIARFVHIPGFARLAGVEVVALADSDPANLAAATEGAKRARGFASWEALLDAGGTDAVVVCLPPALHAEATLRAFAGGNHVYVEKPLALTIADGEAMVAAAAAARGTAQIGFNFRYNPIYGALRDRTGSGATGEVIAVRGLFCSARRTLPGWKATRASGGGALRELGVHHFDLLAWMFGAPVATLTAVERSIVHEADVANVSGSLASGVAFQLTVALATGQSVNRIEVFAERGHFVADTADVRPRPPERPEARFPHVARGLAALGGLAPAKLLARPGFEPSFGLAFAGFAAAAAAGRRATPDLADGLAALELVMAAEHAAATGTPWTRAA